MAKIRVCKDFSQGDDFELHIAHNPIPASLVGSTFQLVLKKRENSGTPVLDVSYVVPAGADATAGDVYLPVTSEETEVIAPGEYFATLKRTIGSDTITILRSGGKDTEKVEKVLVKRNLAG